MIIWDNLGKFGPFNKKLSGYMKIGLRKMGIYVFCPNMLNGTNKR